MFLKSLKIDNDSHLIREITFRKGINLIVDETRTENKQESGNNVGKTSVLRLIDFCLGGDGKNIYQDPEFRSKTNKLVETFLTDNNILITLILKADLDISDSKELKITRNFLSRTHKVLEINDEKVQVQHFNSELKSHIFGSFLPKPTFRQIIAKNIRDEKNRLINTVKVLHPTTKADEYEAVYLFWLGIDLDVSERKQNLLTQKKIEEGLQKRLKKENTLSQVTQSLLVLIRDIETIERKKSNFVINEDYELDIEKLNSVKSAINRNSTRRDRLELRKELILESLDELEKEVSNIDSYKIKRMYEEAKTLIPNLQKTFEQTLSFHNGMIQEKKKYIGQELPLLEKELVDLRSQLDKLLKDECDLAAKLYKSGAMEEYEAVVLELNRAYEKKGTLEEQKRLWEASFQKLDDIKEEITYIDQGISSLDETIQCRVSEFNKYFSQISNELYGEKFVLSADKIEKGYEFNITSLLGNPGTGMKKGEMAAFDLAYMQFADNMGIDCLHFILQDQIENIHDNQISSLLLDVVDKMNCQYVLPVLRDKLPADIDVAKYEILSLAQDDKLFRI